MLLELRKARKITRHRLVFSRALLNSRNIPACLNCIRNDRNRNGGGVEFYVRNTIPYKDRNDLLPNNVEATCIEIHKPNSKPFLISTWHRPPNANIELLQLFEEFLQKVDYEDK